MRTFGTLWRGLGPGLAAGGAFLAGAAFWLRVTVGRHPEDGSFWQLAAGLAVLAAMVAVSLAQGDPAPTPGVGFRARTLPRLAAVACVFGVVVSWWRLPEDADRTALGPAWPAALVGFAVAAVGFVLLALRARTADPVTPGATETLRVVVAVVVALAVPIGTLAVLAPWVRGRAEDARVRTAPLDAPAPSGTPAERWRMDRLGGREILTGASAPVLVSTSGVEGLDPATGEVRWWLRHADRDYYRAVAWNDRIVVAWIEYPTVRGGSDADVRSLVDARTGRVLAETSDDDETFVGDRVVRRPAGCKEDEWAPASGLFLCEGQVRRVDARGRPLWTADSLAGTVAHAGPDAVLLATYQGVVALNPDSGEILWRGERKFDDLVGVTDGVVVWREAGGQREPVTLTGVDLRTGGPLWTRDTGLRVATAERQARAFGATGRGYVDIVHSGSDERPAVTRLSARDGTVAGPAYQFRVRPGGWPVPRPTGGGTLLDTGRALVAIG